MQPCKVTSSRGTFEIAVEYEIAAGAQFQYMIGKAINNPISEKPSESFQILTSANEVASGIE